MRKQFKSMISMALSAAMVVALGSGIQINTKSADAFGYDLSAEEQITLSLKQNNSKVFEPTAEHTEDGLMGAVTVTQSGIYTITAEAADDIEDIAGNDDVKYIGVELGVTSIPDSVSIRTRKISVKHFEKDGSATVADYAWNAQLYHDGCKETGQLRIGVVNKYVPTTAKKQEEYGLANPFLTNVNGTWAPTEAIDVQMGDLVSFTLEVNTSNEPANWEEEHPYQYTTPAALIGEEAAKRTPAPVTQAPTGTPAPTPNLNATSYNAYLAFQTDTYAFRNSWDDAKYGINGKGDKNGKITDYKSQVGYWDGDALKTATAKFTDAAMKENTTYTVSMSGVNLQTLKGAAADSKASTCFNALYVSTDIPVAMKGVSATASLSIDGKPIKTNIAVPTNIEANYYEFYICDLYSDTHGNEKTVAYKKGSLLNVLPTSSVEIKFTIKGVNFKQDFSTRTIGTQKGKTFTKGNLKYKVTSVATETAGKKKAGKVSVVGLTKKGKKAKSLSVPASVTKVGSYKVTSLGKNAFKGAKAKKVTLGKTIKKIPAGAFANCKKLTKLTLKAKLSSVNKKAFKGCKKKIKIAGKSKKANLKKIKKVYKKAK